ncbi:MAG TPA: glycosyltransferase [Bacteroidales bacterium]|nr:glycosyltransferase [Bacteroidales bacterium]
MLAPIALFCFNRPVHLKKTLDSLAKNDLARESELYIFSDGARGVKDVLAVDEVKRVIAEARGFKNIHYTFSEVNKGLANSIIDGVSKVFGAHNRIIVLEDDLEFSPNFLRYMNDCLDFYEHNGQIFSISGYCAPITIPADYKEDVFLFYRINSWGWATWKDRWQLVDWKVEDFDTFIRNKKEREAFNMGGADCSNMLLKQQLGQNNSWAIRFCYTSYKFNKLNVFPTVSKVRNIGADGSGTHVRKSRSFETKLDDSNNTIKLTTPPLNGQIIKAYQRFFKRSLVRKVIDYYEIKRYKFFGKS